MKSEAWLFDLDETLIESDGIWKTSYTDVFTRAGLPVLSYHELLRTGIMKSVGTLSYINATISYAGSSLNPSSIASQVYDKCVGIYLSDGFRMKPGAQELLTKLHESGMPLGLVTGSPECIVTCFTGYTGKRFFDVTVSADDVEKLKPAPDAYRLAMEKLGSDPERCVAVEDSPYGAAAARAAGCGTVIGAGSRKEELLSAGADHVVSSLSDLKGEIVMQDQEIESDLPDLRDLSLEQLNELGNDSAFIRSSDSYRNRHKDDGVPLSSFNSAI